MADNVTITAGNDVVTVTDPTTSVPVVVTEETILIGSEVGQLNIAQVQDVISATDEASNVAITEQEEIIQPNVAQVQIQVVEDKEMPYAKRTDIVSDLLIYKADAAVGSLESDAVWRVKRLTIGLDGDVTEEWANGSASFNAVWSDRASLTYS